MNDEWAGVIYILTNPSFPDLVKIGYADDLDKRLNTLNSNPGLPYAFRVYAYYYVPDRLEDATVHNIIDKLNPDLRTIETNNGKKREREFYAMTPQDAYSLLEGIAKISGTLNRLHRAKPKKDEKIDEQNIEDDRLEVNERRSPFSFEKCGINAGEQIAFLEDPSYVATVEDDQHISYNNATYTTTGLTRELMKKIKGSSIYNWQGPSYWTYKGKRLSDIRKEREENGTYK